MRFTDLLFVCLFAVYKAIKPGNIRMHITTTTNCDYRIKDMHGNPAPCGKSQADETYGMTLPGMDQGTLTTRSDVIVAKDGVVSVVARPDRPFQLFMLSTVNTTQRVVQMYNKGSREVQPLNFTGAPPGYEHCAENLTASGWTYVGNTTRYNASVHKYTKQAPQGVDPETKFNYTALYQTEMFPNLWTLYTDVNDEKLVMLVAVNTYSEEILQTTVYSNYEVRQGDISVQEAMTEMHNTYHVNSSLSLLEEAGNFPPVESDFLSAPFISEDAREYFENHDGVDWLPSPAANVLGASAGIKYFDIPKGSASDKFFHARPMRLLAEAMKFELPPGCKKVPSALDKFCIYVAFDDTPTNRTVNAGISFVDTQDSDNKASLYLSVTFGKSGDSPVLDLNVVASGCAAVWQYGAGSLSLNIVVCITGNASAIGGPGNRTYNAEVEIKVSFNLNLPVVGALLSDAILGKFACTVAPNNEITAFAQVGISRKVLLAGAGVSFDIKGRTVDRLVNKWEFITGVNLNAWVNVLITSASWNWRWEIWHAGPVTF